MDRKKLRQIAEDAIGEYFEYIEPVIDNIVSKIIEAHEIENEDDIAYLKAKIRHGILRLDEE